MKNRVTKLNKTTVELSNGVKFIIVHDFEKMKGWRNSFDAAFQCWLARTEVYTAESFIEYVKRKDPARIFMTLEQYEKIAEPATEDEFLSENN